MPNVYQEELDKILDQYLAGKLNTEEVRRLHTKLESGETEVYSEEDLLQVALPDDIANPLTQAEKIAVKQPLTTIAPDFSWTDSGYRQYKFVSGKYAALFALVFTVILLLPFVHLFMSVGKDQHLVFRYFSMPDILLANRTIDKPTAQNDWNLATLKYRSGNYTAAASALNQMLVYQLPDAYLDRFYLGICYIGLGEPREALQYLQNAALTNTNPDFVSLTQWYIALAYVQAGKPAEARPILQQLAKNTTFAYAPKAAQLLTEL